MYEITENSLTNQPMYICLICIYLMNNSVYQQTDALRCFGFGKANEHTHTHTIYDLKIHAYASVSF